MSTWRFHQGVRGEWRWYETYGRGVVKKAATRGFDQLPACMQDAANAGFAGGSYQVHTRSAPSEQIATAEPDDFEAPVSMRHYRQPYAQTLE